MSRLVRLGALLVLIMVAIGMSACGGTGSTPTQSTTTVTNTLTTQPSKPTPEPSTSTPEPSTSSSASPRPTAADASSVVRQYFAAINARDYQRAWDLGGKNLSGSYEAFVDGFATTAHETVHILRADGDTVTIRLEATQDDGALKFFEGTYTVHSGAIAGADIREVTAPEPQPSETSPDYENCDEARAAGDTPLYVGDPGYAPHLDRDGDGVACEPYTP
jgi:hypothetical protein